MENENGVSFTYWNSTQEHMHKRHKRKTNGMEKRYCTKRNGYSKVNNPLENEWMLHKNDTHIYTYRYRQSPTHGSGTSAYRDNVTDEIKREIEIRKRAYKRNGFAEASKKKEEKNRSTQNITTQTQAQSRVVIVLQR